MTAILDRVAVDVIKRFGKYTAELRRKFLAEQEIEKWMNDPENLKYMALGEKPTTLSSLGDTNHSRMAFIMGLGITEEINPWSSGVSCV